MPKTETPELPGGSQWLEKQAGKISPQLNPQNYPVQNWPERIARGAGEIGGQLAIGRAGATGLQAVRAPTTLPSAITIGKQIAGSAVAGGGAGAGGQTGRGVVSHVLSADPAFSQLHPAAANLLEDIGGVAGGIIGGGAGAGIASKAGIPAGAPARTIPSDELLRMGSRDYTIGRGIPADYRVPAVVQVVNDHIQDLMKNYGVEANPVIRQLTPLVRPPKGAVSVPLNQLVALDDALGKTVKKQMDGQGNLTKLGSAAADTQTMIKDFIKNPTQQTVHSGDPYLVAQYFNRADGNWAAGKRAQTLELAQKRGDWRGTAAQDEIKKLTDPGNIAKKLYGFTEPEQEELSDFAHGTAAQRGMDTAAHAGGWAGVIPAAWAGMETFGGLKGLPLGLVPPAVGYSATKIRRALGDRALGRIIERTKARSPAYQAMSPAERFDSPFRTTLPVGLGAIGGLSDQ
jgi:hypothetical protein